MLDTKPAPISGQKNGDNRTPMRAYKIFCCPHSFVVQVSLATVGLVPNGVDLRGFGRFRGGGSGDAFSPVRPGLLKLSVIRQISGNTTIGASHEFTSHIFTFVIKARVCVAISTGARRWLQRSHIIEQSKKVTRQNASICLRPPSPTGAVADHPEIKKLQRCRNHAWLSRQARPAKGSR